MGNHSKKLKRGCKQSTFENDYAKDELISSLASLVQFEFRLVPAAKIHLYILKCTVHKFPLSKYFLFQ